MQPTTLASGGILDTVVAKKTEQLAKDVPINVFLNITTETGIILVYANQDFSEELAHAAAKSN